MLRSLLVLLLLSTVSSASSVSISLPFTSSSGVAVYVTAGARDGPANITSCSPALSSSSSSSSSSSPCTLRSAVAYCLHALNITEDLCSVLLPPSSVDIDPEEGEILLSDSSAEDSGPGPAPESGSVPTATGTLRILGTSGSLIQPSPLSATATRLFSFVGSSRISRSSSTSSAKTLNLMFSNFTVAHFGNSTTLGGAISLVNYVAGSVGDGVAMFDAVTFRNNSGHVGGAVRLRNAWHVVFATVSFIGNNVSQEGGGLYLETDNKFINISRCVFLDNHAGGLVGQDTDTGLGAGVSVEQRNEHIWIQDSVFYGNAAVRGGGLYLFRDNLFVVMERLWFQANEAYRGGGVYVGQENHNLTFTDCIFEANEAWEDGGGLRVYSTNDHLQLERCTFQSNRAKYGAGFSMNDRNHYVLITASSFLNNSALRYGGGVYMFDNNEQATFENCSFVGNEAVEGNGGFVSIFKDNHDVRFRLCLFLANSAYAGGAVSMYGNNRRMSFEACRFEANFAVEDGGAVEVDNDNWYLEFVSCVFTANYALDDGGAIDMFTKVR